MWCCFLPIALAIANVVLPLEISETTNPIDFWLIEGLYR